MKKIIFICTGNTCRSPMAEGIFRVLLEKHGLQNIVCESAGIHAFAGDKAQPNAVSAAAEYGADISMHRARAYNATMADDTDLFVCMSAQHVLALKDIPAAKIRILGDGVSDPYGGDFNAYRICAAHITQALDDLVNTLLN